MQAVQAEISKEIAEKLRLRLTVARLRLVALRLLYGGVEREQQLPLADHVPGSADALAEAADDDVDVAGM